MPVPIELRLLENRQDIDRLVPFIVAHSQGYADHAEWAHDKLAPRLANGEAPAIIAAYEGIIVGDAVLYPDKEHNFCEIKNFRVDDTYGDEGIGLFVMRQAELHARKLLETTPAETVTLGLDTGENNLVAQRFFERCGFVLIGKAALYVPGRLEYLYHKEARPRRQDIQAT